MDIKQLVISNDSFGVATAAGANGAQANYFPMPKTGSERSNSLYNSESSRYLAPRLLNRMNGASNDIRYPSPTAMQNNGFENGMIQQNNNEGHKRQASGDGNTQKKFTCATCYKGFDRKGDIIRHGRIHTGDRPHVCDHPGCDKAFIQRPALTVHKRVHTGEKPHICEGCGRPFGDSSSLARHRRIHSGKKPFKCPYADCQKTFTRRSALTRHQNQHTGTVEEAAAATAAALATRGGRQYSDGEQYSNNSSQMSTPPNLELSLMNNMHRHPGSYEHNSLLSNYRPPTSYPDPDAVILVYRPNFNAFIL